MKIAFEGQEWNSFLSPEDLPRDIRFKTFKRDGAQNSQKFSVTNGCYDGEYLRSTEEEETGKLSGRAIFWRRENILEKEKFISSNDHPILPLMLMANSPIMQKYAKCPIEMEINRSRILENDRRHFAPSKLKISFFKFSNRKMRHGANFGMPRLSSQSSYRSVLRDIHEKSLLTGNTFGT